MDGYRWFGQNRKRLHRKAVRGSAGGVGLLIREAILERCTVEILESDVEDILWVRMGQVDEEEGEALLIAVCYIPQNHPVKGLAPMNCCNR